ncbi:PTS sugar transporter subunit IIA [Butyrivibrio sp. CB08]|uniref:PTS sugar transporter subunit IIA n=1 Tax=Butyrivibrio sp. CB08 TaxID=2364879 RepID=UPI000EA9DF80|nr:PTS sugar transporter subunit IIA [Butyrivibrio sp. CB08]RKM59976.1 PTS sugar transporter subunit IIA [Butyrivibrio sp. CB08]
MILETRNIFINQEPSEKEDIIRRIGEIFSSQGYTNEYYTQAMLDKEKVFNTYIGNAVAIPHGIEDAKRHIKKTGLVLMTVPEGQDWGAPEKVKVIIGIAAVGDEHLNVLQKIAMTFSDKAGVDHLLTLNEQEISDLFEGEE